LAHWDATLAIFAFEYVAKPLVLGRNDVDAAAIARGTELFNRNAKVLNDQLRGKKFVTGDNLTLADFALGAPMNIAEMAHYPLEPYGEIKRWYVNLCALPAWQKTLAQAAPPAATAA
jgi:glutathione S-transferase